METKSPYIIESASSSGTSFFARWRRATGDEPQGTMGRVQKAGEAMFRPLFPSSLFLRVHFHQERERDVWVRGSKRITLKHITKCSAVIFHHWKHTSILNSESKTHSYGTEHVFSEEEKISLLFKKLNTVVKEIRHNYFTITKNCC